MNALLRMVQKAAASLVVLVSGPAGHARDIETSFVDGLGRPVPNVEVRLTWFDEKGSSEPKEVQVATFVSGPDGAFRATYDEKALPEGAKIWYSIAKPGYQEYSVSGLAGKTVLERSFSETEIMSLAELTGDRQVAELRQVLAGEFKEQRRSLEEIVFLHDEQFRGPLRRLLSDPVVGIEAGKLLAFIGEPEDLREFLRYAPGPREGSLENRWTYFVACALLSPRTPSEWAFLKDCATDRYDDLWGDRAAIMTLRLIGTPESRRVLEEALQTNPVRADAIRKAITSIDEAPLSLTDENVTRLCERVAKALEKRGWQGNEEPLYAKSGRRALIRCNFASAGDATTYAITANKTAKGWSLSGIREVMHQSYISAE